MRVQITFSKQGALRYIGHLDLHKLWERAARRAGLPLSYSRGFHPQPRISLAAALPLGFSSRAELIDMRLNEELHPREILERLKDNLPDGIRVGCVERVDERAPALQTLARSALYEARLASPADAGELEGRIGRLLDRSSIPRTRRGKPYDLRPLVEELTLTLEAHGEAVVKMRLAAREGATGRPEEVLEELGIPLEQARIERMRLVISDPEKAAFS
jgi:radical SAM-linked protein